LTATPQLNVGHGGPDLTGATTSSTAAVKLSKLQRKILLAVAQTDAVPIRELVRKCFGKVAYVKNGEYQAAYASVSRAVRQLKNRRLLQDVDIKDIEVSLDETGAYRVGWCWSPHPVYSWVRLTEQGTEAVKSPPSWRSFNILPPVKSIRSADSFNLHSHRNERIRVFVHSLDFRNEFGGWDSDKLIAAVRKAFG
jgi:hypothetical protein